MGYEQEDPHAAPPDDDEHCKTVYAHFGAAIYFAQVLEHGLVMALVYLDLIPNLPPPVRTHEEWTKSFDGFMEKQFENTLGQLITRLRRVTTVPDELSSMPASALKIRNWLAHDYFRERASEWFTAEGCDRMIAELEDCQGKFREADQLLQATVRPMRLKYGYTDERLAQAYEKLMAKARSQGN